MASVTVARGAQTVGSPASADSLYFLGGNATITTNVDQSGLANGLVDVLVSREFIGQIATAAAPFKSQITGRIEYRASGGDMYYQADGNAAETCVAIHVLASNSAHFHLVGAGTTTSFHLGAGVVTCEAAATVTSWYIAGGTATILDATSTDPTLIEMTGGELKTERGFTTGRFLGGITTIDAGSNTITTLETGEGATVRLVQSGTITQVTSRGGRIDTSSLSSPVTITDCTVWGDEPWVSDFLDNRLITFTNTPVRRISNGNDWS
jgi:hypothetical protein